MKNLWKYYKIVVVWLFHFCCQPVACCSVVKCRNVLGIRLEDRTSSYIHIINLAFFLFMSISAWVVVKVLSVCLGIWVAGYESGSRRTSHVPLLPLCVFTRLCKWNKFSKEMTFITFRQETFPRLIVCIVGSWWNQRPDL